MTAAILRGDVHPTASTLLTGDAAMTAADRDGTRLSDFMPDHLRAFATASGVARWTAVLDREYGLVATLQRDQAWLDALWTAVSTPTLASQPYFDNTRRLLSMIVVSGNAWAP